ncbi:hypothetical protein J1605_004580 [Eschrichtius robustus]|uniref:Uncharacterized protein n=1 Tax=Eschrichtius robustus TaxID=9764 RepID=A0AB34HCP0_ESCRO|nr:hypothetical protein J1605_004580 [Eschrichtius robustus]
MPEADAHTQIFPESLRWLMATHQFASAKKLILRFTQKNRMNPESDIKGVMPGEHVFPSNPQPRQTWGTRHPSRRDRESPHITPGAFVVQPAVQLPVTVGPQIDQEHGQVQIQREA